MKRLTERLRASANTRTPAEQVLRDYNALVWRVLRRLGVAEAECESVSEHVFVTLHRSPASPNSSQTIGAQLCGICVRAAAEYRAQAKRANSLSVSPLPDMDTAGQAGLQAKQARELLDHMLDQLDEPQRQAFVLFEIAGLTIAEVAALLDCHIQTALSRLYAARERLAVLVRAHEAHLQGEA